MTHTTAKANENGAKPPTRGIGLACVRKYAKEVVRVYMSARSTARAQEIAVTLTAEGEKPKCVFNDAIKPETIFAAIRCCQI